MGLTGVKQVKLAYDTLFIEAANKNFTVKVSKVDEMDVQWYSSEGSYTNLLIDRGDFHPLIFSNYFINENFAFAIHKTILACKNLITKEWSFFRL